jgi:DNA-binding MarR family transcriptional regulator
MQENWLTMSVMNRPETAKPPATALPDDPLALERQVCFALSIAARSVLSVYRPLLEPMGLTHPQYLVMLALWGRSPLSVKELGELLQLDSPTLSPLLKRLAAAGLITRTRDPDNERQLRIELTDQSRRLRAEAERIPPAVVARLGVQVSELEDLHAALTSLISAAKAAAVKPLPAPAEGSV